MTRHSAVVEVLGPWSLTASLRFWEGFAPAALPASGADAELRTTFRAEAGWTPMRAAVVQHGTTAHITVEGDGDLDAAVEQVRRFLALDIDGRGWPAVGERDPVIADAQARLPGLRPCGFHSP